MFRVTRYPMISKTESGRVRYRKKYWVAGRVRVPAGHCLARAVDYAQKTKWTIEGLGKKVNAPENNIVDMDDWFEKTEVECRGPNAASGAEVHSAK